MNQNQKAAFVKLLMDTALRYPNARFSQANADAYWDDLRDLPLDMVEAALAQCRAEMDKQSGDFFPSVPRIRAKAVDLVLMANDIPTSVEAWAMFQRGGDRLVEGQMCARGSALLLASLKARMEMQKIFSDTAATREDRENARQVHSGAYNAYSRHGMDCPDCQASHYEPNYEHPSVAETVRILGGRDRILTDNESADRARFIEAYQQIVNRQVRQVMMLPVAREYVEAMRGTLESGENPMIEERQAALETGEEGEFRKQERALVRKMEVRR